MAKYLGFTVADMLSVLKKKTRFVKLESHKQDWRLYVLSDEHGEFEETGSLFNITMKAFKPFAEIAKQEREQFKDLLLPSKDK